MQERRTTVRVSYPCRAQYCAAEDLLPRDGRLINVSERGAGLLAREARKAGEQVTVSFSLPGATDSLTATGVVRWSAPSAKGKWHALGMEWLPLEEGTRNRLHEFLYPQPVPPGAPVLPAGYKDGQRKNISWWLWAVVLVALAIIAAVWVRSFQQEKQRLEHGLQQRNTVITVLQEREQRMAQREAWLRQELVTAKTHLAIASGEMTQLDMQAQSLSADAHRLRQEVDLFQQIGRAHV